MFGEFGPLTLATDSDFCQVVSQFFPPTTEMYPFNVTGCKALDNKFFIKVTPHRRAYWFRWPSSWPDQYKVNTTLVVAYKRTNNVRDYRQFFGHVGQTVGSGGYWSSIITEYGMVVRFSRHSKAYAVLVDVSSGDRVDVIAVFGKDKTSVVVNDIAMNGFVPYLMFRIARIIEPIDWRRRIEKVKEFKTWHPLYGPYYFDKDELDRLARFALNLDILDQLGFKLPLKQGQ